MSIQLASKNNLICCDQCHDYTTWQG